MHFLIPSGPIFVLRCINVSQRNETDVAHYNFNAHQPILAIFGRDVAERVCYQWWFVIPPVLTSVSALPGKNMNLGNCLFSDSGKLGIRRDHPHVGLK